MKCAYMGHFGEADKLVVKKVEAGKLDEYSDSMSDDPYFDDEDNRNYGELRSSLRKDFDQYSDDPFEDYRFQYRQPGMIPVKRPLKSTFKEADSGVTREYVDGDFVAPDKVVASVNSTPVATTSKAGRNIVLGVGAGLAALILMNK